MVTFSILKNIILISQIDIIKQTQKLAFLWFYILMIFALKISK